MISRLRHPVSPHRFVVASNGDGDIVPAPATAPVPWSGAHELLAAVLLRALADLEPSTTDPVVRHDALRWIEDDTPQPQPDMSCPSVCAWLALDIGAVRALAREIYAGRARLTPPGQDYIVFRLLRPYAGRRAIR